MSLTLNAGCAVCYTTSGLARCSRCKVTPYCGPEHQNADFDVHKRACKTVSVASAKLSRREAQLRAMPGDFMTRAGATIFEEEAGHFWGIDETRDYMRARYALIEALMKVKTKDAVQAACDHVRETLRLNRSDNMGVRDIMPFLYLRLGRDQDCYDFVKWYATAGERIDYDWADMELGFLDVKDADALEPVDDFVGAYADLSPMIAVTLIKIKALQDLQALQTLQKLNAIRDRLSLELLNIVRAHLVGDTIARRTDILGSEDHGQRIDDLEAQIWHLFRVVRKNNVYFWPALINPRNTDDLMAKPMGYSEGTKQHMQIMLQFSYQAWKETPGAMDMIVKMSHRR